MKAFVINKYGTPIEAFELVELPKPKISKDEILIKVMATAINPVDYKIRDGSIPQLISSFPTILHGDVAGIVEQVGANVSKFQVGQNVFGYVGGFLHYSGALAEYIVVKPDLITPIPSNLNFVEASALPLVGLTAYQMVFDKVKVEVGHKVLIYGATVGMGHLVLQLAKLCGAEVHAVVSDKKKSEIAKTLGADYTINYKNESIEDILSNYTNGKGYDIVFDNVGSDNLVNSYQLAKINGQIVTTLAPPITDLAMLHEKALSLHIVYMITPFIHEDVEGMKKLDDILVQLSKWAEEGKIKPLVAKIFRFAQVPEAHLYAEKGRGAGKTIIKTDH